MLETTRESLSWLLGVSNLRRRLIVGVAALGIVAGLAQAALLLVIVRAAAAVTVETEELEAGIGPLTIGEVSTSTLIGIAFALIAIYFVAEMAAGWLIARLGAGASLGLRAEVLSRYSEAEWAAKASSEGSSLVQLVTANANQSVTTLVTAAQLVKFTGVFVTLLLSSLVVSAVASVLMIVAMIGLFVLTLPFVRAVRRQSRYASELNKAFAQEVQEITTVGREIQVFGVQERSLAGAHDLNDRQARLQFRRRLASQISGVVFRVAALLLIVAALAAINSIGPGNAASTAAALLILLRSVSTGQAVQANYQSLVEGAPWIAQARHSLEELATHASALRPRPDTAEFEEGQPVAISVKRLSFGYTPGQNVLKSIDVEIDAGQCVGIIGRSGAGKTTFGELLLGLWDPTGGVIWVDGHDLSLIARDDWARRVAYVPQDPVLVSGTVDHNVRFFRPELTRTQIEEAAKDASVTSGAAPVDFGLEVVTSAGRGISGGQRQRVAIARALAGRPGLIVLDEPTSALDVQAESIIADTLSHLRGRSTVVIIAHRLSTLDRCDRILVLAGGEVIAYGPPGELGDLREYLDDGRG